MTRPDEMVDLLQEVAEERPARMIGDLCNSLASFIAEIDASSADVAAYLEQRLTPVLRAAYHHGGIREMEAALADARKLAKK